MRYVLLTTAALAALTVAYLAMEDMKRTESLRIAFVDLMKKKNKQRDMMIFYFGDEDATIDTTWEDERRREENFKWDAEEIDQGKKIKKPKAPKLDKTVEELIEEIWPLMY